MSLLDLYRASPALWLLTAGLVGLAIGSFLNVVIHRLPIILRRELEEDCRALRGDAGETPKPYSLAHPRSACPHCGHALSAAENIPVLSYLWQRGRCRHCQQPISKRYPVIEVCAALLALWPAWAFGFSLPAIGAALFGWFLLTLAVIDLDHQILPDRLVMPLLWLGLLFNLFWVFAPLPHAVIGAAAGYLSLWLVYHLFKLLTGKEGMGYGDFKLFAAFGAWLGWQSLPLIILLASLAGALVGGALILFRRHDRNIPIPFGPFLCIAGWVALFWGDLIVNAYLQFARLGG
jgi:leader peptidase (prepilin peptidase)/N-methyltransferase